MYKVRFLILLDMVASYGISRLLAGAMMAGLRARAHSNSDETRCSDAIVSMTCMTTNRYLLYYLGLVGGKV